MADNLHILCSIELPATLESLSGFIHEITRCAREAGFGEHKAGVIELAVEEAIVNIIKYSYTADKGTISATCGEDSEGGFNIKIVDSGPPFNPLMKDTPDTEASIEDRAVGGLGIFFIKKMADSVDYRREDNKNILTITIYKKNGE